MNQINYRRKSACLITISQLENKSSCEIFPSTIHRCCLSDTKRYKLQFGSLMHFPNLSLLAGKERYYLQKMLALSWHIFNTPVYLFKQLLGSVLHSCLSALLSYICAQSTSPLSADKRKGVHPPSITLTALSCILAHLILCNFLIYTYCVQKESSSGLEEKEKSKKAKKKKKKAKEKKEKSKKKKGYCDCTGLKQTWPKAMNTQCSHALLKRSTCSPVPHRGGRVFCSGAITLKQERGRGWETPICISKFRPAVS